MYVYTGQQVDRLTGRQVDRSTCSQFRYIKDEGCINGWCTCTGIQVDRSIKE